MKKKGLFRTFIAVVMLGLTCTPAYCAEMSAQEIMEKVWGQYRSLPEYQMKASLRNSKDNQSKTAELSIKIGADSKDSIMVKYLDPPILSGTGILTYLYASSAEQWIATKSTDPRKTAPGDSKKLFVNTNLNYYEIRQLAGLRTGDYIFRLIPEKSGKPNIWLILAEPKNKSEYPYDHQEFTVCETKPGQFVIDNIASFVGTRQVKTVLYKNFEFFGNAWRPKQIQIQNHENGSLTEIEAVSTAPKINTVLSIESLK